MKNIQIIGWVVFASILIFGFLWLGDYRTDQLMSVGDCVEKKANEDGFSGSVDLAWQTYAEVCANKQ